MNEQFRNNFTLETADISHPLETTESEEEKRARQLLRHTTHRVPSGCGYETKRTDKPNFLDSYPMAVRRLEALERKLQKDPELQRRVREQIVEYEHEGYAHKASLTSVPADQVIRWTLL